MIDSEWVIRDLDVIRDPYTENQNFIRCLIVNTKDETQGVKMLLRVPMSQPLHSIATYKDIIFKLKKHLKDRKNQ